MISSPSYRSASHGPLPAAGVRRATIPRAGPARSELGATAVHHQLGASGAGGVEREKQGGHGELGRGSQTLHGDLRGELCPDLFSSAMAARPC